MPHFFQTTGQICASIVAAPVMLVITAFAFSLLMLVYLGFALQAMFRHQPSSLHAFFYESWK